MQSKLECGDRRNSKDVFIDDSRHAPERKLMIFLQLFSDLRFLVLGFQCLERRLGLLLRLHGVMVMATSLRSQPHSSCITHYSTL